jgi:hypothetical protein
MANKKADSARRNGLLSECKRFFSVQDSTPSAGITQIRLCGYDLRLENEPPRVKDALFIYRKILFVKENNRCFDQIKNSPPQVGKVSVRNECRVCL